MLPKKMFFPIGGGDELEERIRGAMLVAKYFNTHLEILVSQPNMNNAIPQSLGLSDELMQRLEDVCRNDLEEYILENKKILERCATEAGITISKTAIDNKTTAQINITSGKRSHLVAQQSKFCDMVIAAAPPKGETTATFEAAVIESGKSVIVIPRVLKKFNTNNIIIGWNNSPQASRAVTEAIPIMKRAKKVHIVSSEPYVTETRLNIKDLQNYLRIHDIDSTFEIIKTTLVPGEALLKYATNKNFDLIIAGAYGHREIRELFLGGSAKYILKHTSIPTLLSH
ncbi:MAG: universal stress protein [Sulfurovum sp.]|nr:universal stress protein [Sulfurovum sp.]